MFSNHTSTEWQCNNKMAVVNIYIYVCTLKGQTDIHKQMSRTSAIPEGPGLGRIL